MYVCMYICMCVVCVCVCVCVHVGMCACMHVCIYKIWEQYYYYLISFVGVQKSFDQYSNNQSDGVPIKTSSK